MQPQTACPRLPSFLLVQRAFRIAAAVESRSPESLAVGIFDSSGLLLASGVLCGYRQLAVFAELLRLLGYREMMPRTVQRLGDCHAGFLAPLPGAPHRPEPALPQSVLDVDCWPDFGVHAAAPDRIGQSVL